MAVSVALPLSAAAQAAKAPVFNRLATFEAATNVPAGRNVSKKSVAEIVAASPDGRTLVYTDGEQQGLGFIDISNPAQPKPAGFVAVPGEPTSVVVSGGVVLAGVSTTKDFTQPGGLVVAIDLKTREVLSSCDLGGQPDALALDRSGRVLSVVIENERDERLNKGVIPQLPPGNLTLLPLQAGRPDCAGKKVVALTGLAAIAPTDPEPELVKVNAMGEAIVSLQENNHFALVNTSTGALLGHFSAGAVDLTRIDRKRDGQINPVDSATGLKREPDAVAWLDSQRFVSANEGDYEGGSRSFSIFNKNGQVEWDSGALLEHIAMRHGHYPEHRSGSKGTEPEGIEAGRFGSDNLIFVGLERASLVVVFKDMGAGREPQLLQVLPAGSGPEGLLAIPQRNLLVVAAENDGAARSTVMIYQRGAGTPAYPHLVSADGPNGLPIPWGAISGLAADRKTPGRFYAVTDSAYAVTRVLEMDTTRRPAVITRAFPLTKGGQPVGFDGEGIVQREDGGFWIASEGDPDKKPTPVRDLLIRVSADGAVQEEIELPEGLRRHAVRFGLEGVTTTGSGSEETVWLAVQREWKDDPKGLVKILRYHVASKAWGVLHYPLDAAGEGAWMGLSEITAVGPDRFIVIERDNTFGLNSRKTLHMFSTAGITPAAVGATSVPAVAAKRLLMDLKPLMLEGRGYVLDKVESFAIDAAGEAVFITDNDAVDGSNGETQLIRLGRMALPSR